MTAQELMDLGFSERTVSLVDACTHDSTMRNKDARWVKMIARLIDLADKDAWAIKCADLFDNYRSCHTMPNVRAAFIRTVIGSLTSLCHERHSWRVRNLAGVKSRNNQKII